MTQSAAAGTIYSVNSAGICVRYTDGDTAAAIEPHEVCAGQTMVGHTPSPKRSAALDSQELKQLRFGCVTDPRPSSCGPHPKERAELAGITPAAHFVNDAWVSFASWVQVFVALDRPEKMGKHGMRYNDIEIVKRFCTCTPVTSAMWYQAAQGSG